MDGKHKNGSGEVGTDKVKARIEARRWAEECYQSTEDKGAFFQRVKELHCPDVPKSEPLPMTDDQARKFEETRLFFGAHNGKQVGEVPLSYLCRLTDPSSSMDEFIGRIRRYLRNPGIRKTIEAEGEDA